MDLSQTHAQRHVQLQIAIVEHIAVLVVEVWDQLLKHLLVPPQRRGGRADSPTVF